MSHWHILGPGAIGSLWASGFCRADLPCCLLVPEHHPLNTTEVPQPLKLCIGAASDPGAVSCAVQRQYATANGRIDNLLICLKAFQVLPAVTGLLHRLHSGSTLLLLHNGLGTLEPLSEILPDGCRVLQGTTTHGAFCPTPHTVVHAGQGETRIGPGLGEISQHEQQAITETLSQALPPVIWQQDIEQALWLKLAINCAINPLTALEQCQNGELMRTDRLGTVQAVCEECAQVINACASVQISGAELFNLVRGVIAQTAENYSSMNRDLAAGKPSEIDYITGYLLRQGERLGLELPANQALYQAVKLYKI